MTRSALLAGVIARAAAASLALAFALAAGCVLGGEPAGCRDDAECPGGFICRAGACFRGTTGRSPPADDHEEEEDAGADGDSG
ncbi:MAG: hypothetical protein IT372_17525 [Polyangiaceae bacterium]|nr:hypothetical protein [Polyangiaceae bacterium]